MAPEEYKKGHFDIESCIEEKWKGLSEFAHEQLSLTNAKKNPKLAEFYEKVKNDTGWLSLRKYTGDKSSTISQQETNNIKQKFGRENPEISINFNHKEENQEMHKIKELTQQQEARFELKCTERVKDMIKINDEIGKHIKSNACSLFGFFDLSNTLLRQHTKLVMEHPSNSEILCIANGFCEDHLDELMTIGDTETFDDYINKMECSFERELVDIFDSSHLTNHGIVDMVYKKSSMIQSSLEVDEDDVDDFANKLEGINEINTTKLLNNIYFFCEKFKVITDKDLKISNGQRLGDISASLREGFEIVVIDCHRTTCIFIENALDIIKHGLIHPKRSFQTSAESIIREAKGSGKSKIRIPKSLLTNDIPESIAPPRNTNKNLHKNPVEARNHILKVQDYFEKYFVHPKHWSIVLAGSVQEFVLENIPQHFKHDGDYIIGALLQEFNYEFAAYEELQKLNVIFPHPGEQPRDFMNRCLSVIEKFEFNSKSNALELIQANILKFLSNSEFPTTANKIKAAKTVDELNEIMDFCVYRPNAENPRGCKKLLSRELNKIDYSFNDPNRDELSRAIKSMLEVALTENAANENKKEMSRDFLTKENVRRFPLKSFSRF